MNKSVPMKSVRQSGTNHGTPAVVSFQLMPINPRVRSAARAAPKRSTSRPVAGEPVLSAAGPDMDGRRMTMDVVERPYPHCLIDIGCGPADHAEQRRATFGAEPMFQQSAFVVGSCL